MVAVVVLSFGLLAVAGFQARVLASSNGAHFGDHAARLSIDMAERIRANPFAASRKVGGSYYVELGKWGKAADEAPSPNCTNAPCDTWQVANRDIWAWKTAVAKTLPEGDASIVEDGDQLRLLVTWKDNAQLAAPPNANSGCPTASDRSCLRLVIAIPHCPTNEIHPIPEC
jgi:type IV pilus assembly protein PilV